MSEPVPKGRSGELRVDTPAIPGLLVVYLNLADPTIGVTWPIPLAESTISAADARHPLLDDVRPMPPLRTVIIGGNGQLGRALRRLLPDAESVDLPEFDCTDQATVAGYPWRGMGAIINAAAYTAVDAAETPEGRRACWAANVTGVPTCAGSQPNTASRWYASPPTTSSTAPPRYTQRTSRSARWGSTARPRPQPTPSSDNSPATTCSAPAGSSARAATSSAPWQSWQQRASSLPSSPTSMDA